MRHFCLLVATTTLLLTALAVAKKDEAPKFKSIEVKHFPNAEGVELPPEFSDFLYAELRAELQKKKVAEQFLGEDEVVDKADADKSVVLDGSILEYKKGSAVKATLIGFGAGNRSLRAHIKVTRRGDNQAIIDKDITVKALPTWDPKALAKFLAGEITRELRHTE